MPGIDIHALPDAYEGLQTPPDVPGWSESRLVQAYFPDAGIGIWTHSNRCDFDTDLWSEVLLVYLPDDRFLVAKGFGYATGDGDVGGCLSYRHEVPFQTSTTSFRGAAQPLAGDVLRAGPGPSGRHVGVELELRHEAVSPPLTIGELTEGAIASHHYEQHMTAVGHLVYDGHRIELSGAGMRDHSWGVRDMSRLGRHTWLHGEFPDGRWFDSISLGRRGGGDALLEFHSFGDREGETSATLLTDAPLLDDRESVWDGYELRLQTPSGIEVIEAEILQVAALTYSGLSELVLGVDESPDSHLTLYECQTRYAWNGQVGYGLTERSILH